MEEEEEEGEEEEDDEDDVDAEDNPAIFLSIATVSALAIAFANAKCAGSFADWLVISVSTIPTSSGGSDPSLLSSPDRPDSSLMMVMS